MPINKTGANTPTTPTQPPLTTPNTPESGKAFGRSVSVPDSVNRQTNGTTSGTAGRTTIQRSVSLPDKFGTQSLSDSEPVAGRGKVKILDNGRIEKEMAKWEVINYSRIFQNPANSKLAAFCPKDIILQDISGKEVDLRQVSPGDPHLARWTSVEDSREFPVQLTNAAPSGKVLDVKLGDIISTTADAIHGKTSGKRTAKRQWHILKQNTNHSGVTIQDHKGGVKRELDELKKESQFLPLLMKKTSLGQLPSQEQKSAMAQMHNQLDDLKEAVKESQVGFVGASVLLSFENGQASVTLIDVENCVLPEDPGVKSSSIPTKKDHFIRGIETLQKQLSGAG